MKIGLWVPELLWKTTVNDVDLLVTLADSNKEVIRFDIPDGTVGDGLKSELQCSRVML
jgi:hypothetical protein